MPEITEPAYPLTKAAFTRALMTGHGRALIHVECHGVEGVRDEILDAALFPKVYDSQCNGYGESWLARLCGIAGLVDRVISETGGSAELRCSMLVQFARSGHPAALPALRAMCRYDAESNDLLAGCEIVELEGEEDYRFVVERAGEALSKHSEYWISDIFELVLDEKLGEGRALAILDRESPGNRHIAAYREAVVAYRARTALKPDLTPPPVDELIEQILASAKRIPRLPVFGERASPGDRRKVASLDFAIMEPIPLQNFLCYFTRSGFPELQPEHLTLLRHPEERVRWWAHSALSHHAEPPVRQAAYEALERREVEFFVKLLCRSGLAEDIESLLTAIHAPAVLSDRDETHAVVWALVHLVRENGNMGDLRLPVWIYEFSPCRSCRNKAVKVMAERSILPRWIARECLSDAYEDTREIASKYLGVERDF